MAKAKTTTQPVLIVQRRAAQGTRPVRMLRHQGLIPGVVYGRTMEPVTIAVQHKALMQLLHSKAGEHTLVKLRIEDTKPWEKPVLVKDLQHDPVNGQVIHVDFHAIALTEQIRVKIPVVLKGEPVGVKQDGGILEHFLREIEVECLPTDIPEGVEFDVNPLKIGETVHVRDLIAPKQAKIVSDPGGAIASVQAPKEEKVEEAPAITEPEVIREKKEAPEGAAAEKPSGESKKEDAKDAKAEKKEKT